ncbi:MAG: hypothetical protein E6R03_04120 [Hyphomicrobiaceae bacterium]|nr:MAG: hypothetical protein E6R03_04120 [Hyphomicrobiaceae bacterium]
MKPLLFIFLATTITACDYCWQEGNKKEQQRIFMACMMALPAGPQSTHYNDWSEVVDSCNEAAYRQSLEKKCTWQDGK